MKRCLWFDENENIIAWYIKLVQKTLHNFTNLKLCNNCNLIQDKQHISGYNCDFELIGLFLSSICGF